MGSVKDLSIERYPSRFAFGSGIFLFSDRYSVLDWGEMPDHIPEKGIALCSMAGFTFEELKKRGIPTHYNIEDNAELEPNEMRIRLAKVVKPKYNSESGEWDYSFFKNNRGKFSEFPQFLVPLEIVFRNGLPEGSSVLRKLRKAKEEGNEKYIEAELERLGLSEMPQAGQMLPRPVLTFATKLEPTDRDLRIDEAYEISGLKEDDFEQLLKYTDKANETITELAERAGMKHYDGKIEFIHHFGEPMIADVAGTFDENRFMIDVDGEEVQVSKEFLRQWYRNNDPEWVAAVEEAKKKGLGDMDLRYLVKVQPKALPEDLPELISKMYLLGAERYTGRKIKHEPIGESLEDVMRALRPYMK